MLYELNSFGAKTTFTLPVAISGLALNGNPGLVLAGPTGIHLWSAQGSVDEICTEWEGEALSFNDVVANRNGSLYAGTLYLTPDSATVEKRGKLYFIDANGTRRVVDDGFEMSNGLSLSPDDKTLSHADTALRCIYAYSIEPETGDLFNRKVFAQIPLDFGVPDGITVDGEGHVRCACWFGAKVIRFDLDGRIERSIAFPVTQVSSVAFGGPELTNLYITTAAERWATPLAPSAFYSSQLPCGGSLYRCRLEIMGKLEHRAGFHVEPH